MPLRTISPSKMVALLGRRGDALSRRALELVKLLPDGADLLLSRQPADGTSETFRLKYRLAAERGVGVRGLNQLLNTLDTLAREEVDACVVKGDGEFAVIFVDPGQTKVHGVLGVEADMSSDA